MKGLALILLFVAAAQARSADVQSVSTRAAPGENPWLVHLRVAVSTSGFLETCTGSLIDARWVLTSASCVRLARFIWVRYGAVDVFSPTLVTESSTIRVHPTQDIALVSLNRNVLSPASNNIAPVVLARPYSQVPYAGQFCGYGDINGTPGQRLSCRRLHLREVGPSLFVGDVPASRFDIGGALVQNGVQYGILIRSDWDSSVFLNPASYRDWIQREANIFLPIAGEVADAPLDDDRDMIEEDLLRFVESN